MNKRKQIILVIAVLLVAFCSFVYLKKQFFSSSKPKEETIKKTLVFDSSLKDITLIDDERYVLVSPKDVNWQSNDLVITRNYVVSSFVSYDQTYSKDNVEPAPQQRLDICRVGGGGCSALDDDRYVLGGLPDISCSFRLRYRKRMAF